MYHRLLLLSLHFFFSWESKKQFTDLHTSAKADYHDLAHTTFVLVWPQWFLQAWVFLLIIQLLCIMVAKILLKLQIMKSFFNTSSILRLIVILCDIFCKALLVRMTGKFLHQVTSNATLYSLDASTLIS